MNTFYVVFGDYAFAAGIVTVSYFESKNQGFLSSHWIPQKEHFPGQNTSKGVSRFYYFRAFVGRINPWTRPVSEKMPCRQLGE
jgi:hypothetical protein